MVKKTLPFKKLIINELSAFKENKYISRIMIFKNISKKSKNKHSQKRLKSFINRALQNLVDKKEATRKKQSFKLSKIYFKRLLKKKQNSKKTKGKGKKLNKNSKKSISKASNKTKFTLVASTKKQNKKVSRKTKIYSATQSAPTPMLTTMILQNFPSTNTLTSYSKEQKYKKRHPAIWQFYDINNFNAKLKRSDGWYDYDAEASDLVDDEWQRYIINRGMNDVRSVKSGQWEYLVDFVNWKQTNILHQNHTVRQIRRIDEKGEVTKNPHLN